MATKILTKTEKMEIVLAGKDGNNVEILNVEFKPEAGEVIVAGYRSVDLNPPPVVFKLDDGQGPPMTFEEMVAAVLAGERFGDNLPPSVLLGGILIEVFEPGATVPTHSLETKDWSNELTADDVRNKLNLLTFNVPAVQAKRVWKCRLTNLSPERSLCRAIITMPWVTIDTQETRISRRLLNRKFAELLKAFCLQIYANPWMGLVAINEDIKHLADGIITQTRFDVDKPFTTIRGLELTQLDIDAGTDGSFPEFKIHSKFVTNVNIGSWEIFGVDIIEGLEIREVDIDIEVMLNTSKPTTNVVGNAIIPIMSVNVDIKGQQGNVLLPVELGANCNIELSTFSQFSLKDVEELIACNFKKFFTEPSVRTAMIKYLTLGFRELAQRNHFLWSIRADAPSYIVEHFKLPIAPIDSVTEEFEGGGNVVGGGTASGNNNGSAGNFIANLGTVFNFDLEDLVEDADTGGANDDEEEQEEDTQAEDTPVLRNLDKIEHIVVLMMENRSFDHLFGYLSLHKGRDDINGLTGDEFNIKPGTTDGNGNPVRVPPFPVSNHLKYSPYHDHENVKSQINKGKMDGFVKNFLDRFKTDSPEWVMSYYREDVLTTYDRLADTFAVCDNWFSAHPGPTWPNRLCTLTGRILELENFVANDKRVGYIKQKTVFDFLDENNISWLNYEHDISFLRMFDKYRLDDERILPFSAEYDPKGQYAPQDYFEARAANGTLPSVTFIDPNYADFPPFETANDDHPPADLANGQELVRRIYNALVQSPQWAKTLFVVTYDEHGGFFDHVAPPGTEAAPTPNKKIPKIHKDGPNCLGVRVPTIVISPWVQRTAEVNHRLFDHTSIIKTIFLKFNNREIPKGFGKRINRVNHLGVLLQRDNPLLDPPIIPELSESMSQLVDIPEENTVANDFHDAIERFALPSF